MASQNCMMTDVDDYFAVVSGILAKNLPIGPTHIERQKHVHW